MFQKHQPKSGAWGDGIVGTLLWPCFWRRPGDLHTIIDSFLLGWFELWQTMVQILAVKFITISFMFTWSMGGASTAQRRQVPPPSHFSLMGGWHWRLAAWPTLSWPVPLMNHIGEKPWWLISKVIGYTLGWEPKGLVKWKIIFRASVTTENAIS